MPLCNGLVEPRFPLFVWMTSQPHATSYAAACIALWDFLSCRCQICCDTASKHYCVQMGAWSTAASDGRIISAQSLPATRLHARRVAIKMTKEKQKDYVQCFRLKKKKKTRQFLFFWGSLRSTWICLDLGKLRGGYYLEDRRAITANLCKHPQSNLINALSTGRVPILFAEEIPGHPDKQ